MRIDYNQLEFIHPKLRAMVSHINLHCIKEQIITSLYRMNDPGVHGILPLRGTDLRCRDRVYGEELVNWVNRNWEYDPTRDNMFCAILHGEGLNMHIHLQVHPNTRQIKHEEENSKA